MFDNTQEFYEDLQVSINVDLQKLVAHYMEKGADPFATFSYINAISEQYIANLKEQYAKMAKDRRRFDEDFNKELVELAETIEE